MLVNGKPDNGDVILEDDGYMRVHFTNPSGVWFSLLIAPDEKGGHTWFSEPRTSPLYVGGKHVLNIKDLLRTVRKEMLDESSS